MFTSFCGCKMALLNSQEVFFQLELTAFPFILAILTTRDNITDCCLQIF